MGRQCCLHELQNIARTIIQSWLLSVL